MSCLRVRVSDIASLYRGKLIELNGEADHVHILLERPPTVTPASFVCVVKTKTSKEMRNHFFERIKSKLWGSFFWSDGYFTTTTGGASIDVLRKYIQNQ